jgi:hypothetical protein
MTIPFYGMCIVSIRKNSIAFSMFYRSSVMFSWKDVGYHYVLFHDRMLGTLLLYFLEFIQGTYHKKN